MGIFSLAMNLGWLQMPSKKEKEQWLPRLQEGEIGNFILNHKSLPPAPPHRQRFSLMMQS